MDINLFDYELPKELIAQTPLEKRDSSRLLVLNKNNGNIKHEHFNNIKNYLKKGDVLGKLLVKDGNNILRKVDLIANNNVNKLGYFKMIFETLKVGI